MSIRIQRVVCILLFFIEDLNIYSVLLPWLLHPKGIFLSFVEKQCFSNHLVITKQKIPSALDFNLSYIYTKHHLKQGMSLINLWHICNLCIIYITLLAITDYQKCSTLEEIFSFFCGIGSSRSVNFSLLLSDISYNHINHQFKTGCLHIK